MSFAMGSGKGSDVRTTVRFVRNVESSSMLADCGTRAFAFEISARMYSDSWVSPDSANSLAMLYAWARKAASLCSV